MKAVVYEGVMCVGKRLSLRLVSAVLLLVTVMSVPRGALAANEGRDILLGAFFTSEEDVTDTVYASYDGETFYAIATPYRDNTPQSASENAYAVGHYTHKCPGICYYNGYYWMISNWNKNDGKFHPMLSYSKDLVRWTHPEGGTIPTACWDGIALDVQPDNKSGAFDVVAPKMHVASDGNLYITFCAGDYRDNGSLDKMQVYTCKVTQLSATDGTSSGGDGYLWPNITFKTETAKKVTASAVNNAADQNIIDSNLYAEDGYTYLLLKRDGLTEEIYRSQTPNDPASWQLVNAKASYGYEGVSIAKANGTYYLCGDGVRGTKDLGIRVVTSNSITRTDEWSDAKSTADEKLHAPRFVAENGSSMSARHGDVITLKAGTAEWKLVKSLLDERAVPTSAVAMYRLYNPNSGEHFYTASKAERDSVVAAGWKYEGIGWYAPKTSNTPVYRLYSGTDHHYTMSVSERDWLISVGWKYEGTGWYSDDSKGVALYRQFNPNVDPSAARNNSGSHNYTTSKSENDYLVSVGWRAEGIGWYGVN